MLKQCSKCAGVWPTAYFTRNTRSPDGLRPDCRMCKSIRSAFFRMENREKILPKKREYHHRNRDAILVTKKKHYAENRVAVLARNKTWRDSNKERCAAQAIDYYARNKEAVLAYHKRYYRDNPEKTFEWQARRLDRIRKSTPPWVNRSEIRAVYVRRNEAAELFGAVFHVDHIVPLRNKRVCGLHVPWNLAVIPAAENFKKQAKFDEREAIDLTRLTAASAWARSRVSTRQQ